jgi:hypothetical protein
MQQLNPNSDGQTFNIGSLLRNIHGGLAENPRLYEKKKTYPIAFDIVRNNLGLLITTENMPKCDPRLQNLRVLFQMQDINKLKNVRHEIVSSMCTGGTDIPFSVIDPTYDARTEEKFHSLTPDYFDEVSRRIGELSTSAGSEEKILQNSYKVKFDKYRPYLQRCHIYGYAIFIVSPQGVYTNYPITQKTVDLLCARCNLGLSVEARVIAELGYDPFHDKETTEKQMMVEAVLNDIKVDSSFSIDDFDIDEINNIALGEWDQEGKKKAIELLAKTFKSAGVSKKSDRRVLEKYLKSFENHPMGTRSINDLKRVIPFPLVGMRRHATPVEPLRLDHPFDVETPASDKSVISIWREAFSKGVVVPVDLTETEEQKIKNANDVHSYEKYRNKKWHKFRPDISHAEKLDAAKSGLMAKSQIKLSEELRRHEHLSHASFSPEANTDDIEKFLTTDIMTELKDGKYPFKLQSLLNKAKSFSQSGVNPDIHQSTTVFTDFILNMDIVKYADFISCLVEELAYCKKHFTKANVYMYRYLKHHRAGIIIHNAGDHLFFSVAMDFDTEESNIFETGRIGPELYRMDQLLISDWSSVDSAHIEHYLKAGPYMASILSHLMGSFRFDPFEKTPREFSDWETNRQVLEIAKTILLIFLNNKLDLEETVTAMRYFYMSIMDEYFADSYKFTNRLPEVIRSRMTSYMLKKIIWVMDYYDKHKISRSIISTSSEAKPQHFNNLHSIFCDGTVTIEQLIDSFYYGYVVSKNRTSGIHNTFAITQKLMKEEFKYLKNKEKGIKVLDELETWESHRTDKNLLKLFIGLFRDILRNNVGPEYMALSKTFIIDRMSKTTFSDLATLKVSAKEHVELPNPINTQTFKDVSEQFKAEAPKEFSRRPKALEQIVKISDRWESDNKRQLKSPIEMVSDCLARLEAKDGFDSDLFSKSQHGGHREIHVLEIDARIVQYYLESISKALCGYFQSETITHPKTKTKFVPEHYKDASLSFGDFITMSKSADAKTWCQNHFVSRFACMLVGLTDPCFHGFILRTLRLWVMKRVTLPAELIAMFLSNERTESSNEVFKEMRSRLHSGSLPFLKPGGATVRISSGMFQGILHYSSSLYHCMIQEVYRHFCINFTREFIGKEAIMTVVEGSDDTGAMLSIQCDGKNYKALSQFMCRILRWKEEFANYLGVINSHEKSVLGVLDLVEYNSEWWVRQKSVKPTFRWVSACMETNLVENFVSRYRTFSNTLTQTLEGGATTFECALIQCSQAWLHYKLMGMDSNPVFKAVSNKWLEFPSPSLGFFPLDPDLTSGLTGFDFSAYLLARNSEYKSALIDVYEMMETPEFSFQGQKISLVSKEAQGVEIKFSKDSIWKKLISGSKLPSMEECVEFAEAHPQTVFGSKDTWRDDKINIALKMHSPGVKASLSTHSSTLRMQVASAYLLNTPCFTVAGEKEKLSLLTVMEKRSNRKTTDAEDDLAVRIAFPNFKEYEDIYQFIESLRQNTFRQGADYSKKNKIVLEIYSSAVLDEYPLIGLCKMTWFKKNVLKTGKTLHMDLWDSAKEKYPFLRDTLEETKKATKMNTLQLKYFLESILSKTRKVTLSDSQARSSGFKSTITRVFWPGVKLRNKLLEDQTHAVEMLRHTLFCIASYFYSVRYRTELMGETIKQSEVFGDGLHEDNPKISTLSIFHDFLTKKKKKHELLDRIKAKKRSVIGFFSVRQPYDPKTRRRTGKGEWFGSTGDVSIKILMNNHDATSIVISKDVDLDNIGYALRDILSELHLGYPGKKESGSKAYLRNNGTIVGSASEVPKNSVPISMDHNLKVDVRERLLRANWFVRADTMAIRLIAQERNSTDEFTIMTELFTTRDWDHTLDLSIDCDTGLQAFAANRPWSDEEVEEFTSTYLPPAHAERVVFYKDMKRNQLFDKAQLNRIILKQYCHRKGMDKEEIMAYVQVAEVKLKERIIVTEEEVEELRQSFMPSNFDLKSFGGSFSSEKILDWADEVTVPDEDIQIHNLSIFGESFNAADTIETARYLTDLLSSETAYLELKELRDFTLVGMPASNRFFATMLKDIERDCPEIALAELHTMEFVKFHNPWGMILSMSIGKDVEDLDSVQHRRDKVAAKGFRGSSDGSHGSLETLKEQIEILERQTLSTNHDIAQVARTKLQYAKFTYKRLSDFAISTCHDMKDLETMKTSVLIYEVSTYLHKYANYNPFPHFSLEREELMPEMNHRQMVIGQHIAAFLKMIRDLQRLGKLDNDTAIIYQNAVTSDYVTRDFLEIFCTFHEKAIEFTYQGNSFYRTGAIVGFSESDEDGTRHMYEEKIVFDTFYEDVSVDEVEIGETEVVNEDPEIDDEFEYEESSDAQSDHTITA